VTIVNRAISVNPVDWKVVAGYLKEHRPVQFPAVPGNETAGVIEAVGPGVEGFSVGDEIIWSGFTGAYRAQANVQASALFPKPANIDFDQAASLPGAGGTAHSAAHQIGIGIGDTVHPWRGRWCRLGRGADRDSAWGPASSGPPPKPTTLTWPRSARNRSPTAMAWSSG